MLSSKVDGLFIFFGSLENEAYFRKLEKTEKTPIVFLARYLDNCSIPYVAVDNRYAAKCMVEYVYAKGHRKLTYIDTSGGAMLSPMRDRRKGVEAECEKIGIEYQVYKFQAQKDDIEAGYKAE